jgi:general secretion pathway protein K
MGGEQAEILAASVKDWIDADNMERPNGAEEESYSSNDLETGPGNRPFIMVEELLQVLGVSWELFQRMEPGLTVHSEARQPEPAYAPVEALLALPEMTPEEALNFVAERHSQDATGGVGVELPDGQVAMARGRGLTYSIQAKATLPNGVWDQVEATIRLGGSPDGRPFRILRWREGFHH